jgi:hypothetical protein
VRGLGPPIGLTVLGFALRLGYGLARGEDAFLNQGYTFYREIAATFLGGDGLCVSAGVNCALRVPLYPLIVSGFLKLGWLYPGLPILQAAVGAGECVIAWGIGRALCNERTAVIAAALAAVNPYAVMHGTAMQETTVFNVLIALSVFLLLRTQHLSAGAALGLAMLTSLRLALFAPLAVLWAWRSSWRQGLLTLMPILLLVGGWVTRNWLVTGAPVLTTESGLSLWVANHPATLDFYPERSIDLVTPVAFDTLPPERQRALSAASEVDADRLMAGWAIEYMLANPGRTAVNMIRKVAWAFSGRLSPAREGIIQPGFALVFVPLSGLALLGLWRSRHQGGGHVLVYLLFTAFAITTAVYWAHTSHTSTLHVFLCVYAASELARWRPRLT